MTTSIIMNSYIKNRMVANMTIASLSAIRMFTDTNPEYEIIVIDNEPEFQIRDDYETLKIDKYVKNEEDIGCYASYNLGASKADGENLVFIQNDVFVHEGWLKWLLYYTTKGFDVVFADQYPKTRKHVLETYDMNPDSKSAMMGWRDAGCMLITKKGFDKVSGWPEGTKSAILSEKFMYERIGNGGLTWTDARKSIITHICAATNLLIQHEDEEEYFKRMDSEERDIQP